MKNGKRWQEIDAGSGWQADFGHLELRLEHLEGILAGPLEALLGGLPVDDVPDVLHVSSFSVQILDGRNLCVSSCGTAEVGRQNKNLSTNLEVVRMLPHVHTEDGYLATDGRILVLRGNDTKTRAVLDQPAPATSLNAQQGC